MSSLQELLAQKAALEQKIEATRREAQADAIAKVKALMAEHGLTVADLGGGRASSGGAKAAKSGGKVAIKYRDNAGNTWTGRGLQPKWLKSALASGKSLSDFTV